MADPTASAYGTAKTEVSNSTTATLVSDSGTVAVGDWLVVLIGGAFGATAPTITYSVAKSAGTATVGTAVCPTSPLSQAALTSNLDVGSGYRIRLQAWYLPVTGAGTLTVTASRMAGSFDHGWCAHFIQVLNPNGIGAVGIVDSTTSSTTLAVTMDAANASTSCAIMWCLDNNGDTPITQPSGTTEVLDTSLPAFGIHMESAKKEGSPATTNTFSGLIAGTGGHSAVAFEITSAGGAPAAPVATQRFVRQALNRSATR